MEACVRGRRAKDSHHTGKSRIGRWTHLLGYHYRREVTELRRLCRKRVTVQRSRRPRVQN